MTLALRKSIVALSLAPLEATAEAKRPGAERVRESIARSIT